MMKQLVPKQSAALTAGLSFLAAVLLAVGFSTTSAQAAEPAATFTFTDSAVTAAGGTSGYEIDGTDLTITSAGTYEITGSCADGSVTVKKGTTGVTLVLNGLTLTSTDSAALSCNKETEVTVQLTGASTLTDGEDIADEAESSFDGAAVKVKSDGNLTITGTGALTVNGNCKNGIKGAANATVTVAGGTLNVTAENNGIACDNAVVITGGTVTVTAGNDGIKAEPDEGDTTSAGTVTITGGNLKITSAGDAVQSVGDMTITGGTFQITSEDDAFKSAGNITVTGGTFTISAADDGISADYVLTVGTEGASAGPAITITRCTEGLEGAAVNLHSGKADIVSSDDGINAANGDLTGYTYAITVTGGTWTVNANGDAMDSNGSITITGGLTELYGAPNNGNNALDYEGVCTVTGGTLFTVDCTGMNQVPSYGTYVVFGKTGGMGMAPGGQMPQTGENGQMPEPPAGMTLPDLSGGQSGQRPQFPATTEGMTMPNQGGGSSGQQGGFPGGMNNNAVDTSAVSIRSGSKIVIKDSSGNTLYSATGTKTANCVMLASADLTAGETYTLYVDGEAVATAEAAEGTGQGGFTPGGGQIPGQQGQQPGQEGTQPPAQPEQGQQPAQPGQTGQTGAGYTDVADDAWYADAVNYVTQQKMMQGTGSATFSPNAATTRAMVVTILYRLEGSPAVTSSSYTDVSSDSWYADAVAWAEANNIVQGTGSGKFSPDSSVTRQQLAAILYRYAQYKGYDVSQTADLSGFRDGTQVQSYARTAMEWACGVKLIQGADNNALLPAGSATRAQVATILQRLCETIAK